MPSTLSDLNAIFRKPLEGIERPQMPADVVIVGGGPAGMACALRLRSSSTRTMPRILIRSSAKKIFMFSRKLVRSVSIAFPAHCSIPAPCASCCPDFEKEAPLDAEVTKEAVYF